MSGRRRAALLTGRALSVAGVVATLSVALIRYTGIQELGFRMMGIAAVSVALTGLAGLVAMAGVLLQLVARRRPTRWTWWSLAGAALPVLLVLEMTAPALAGAVAPERATTGTPFGVVVQNLYYQHEDPGRSLAAVLERRADVLVLIEFTPEAERILDDRWGDEVRARYPHQWRDARGFRRGPRRAERVADGGGGAGAADGARGARPAVGRGRGRRPLRGPPGRAERPVGAAELAARLPGPGRRRPRRVAAHDHGGRLQREHRAPGVPAAAAGGTAPRRAGRGRGRGRRAPGRRAGWCRR